MDLVIDNCGIVIVAFTNGNKRKKNLFSSVGFSTAAQVTVFS